ncbi:MULTISPECIES: hypothetical protein [Geobacillus]|nr:MULTISPECIES: hypothetical protein [Geobacillus]EQB96111.1 hypothetical protein GA8_08100 [Geobacillus sp. A8]
MGLIFTVIEAELIMKSENAASFVRSTVFFIKNVAAIHNAQKKK